MTIGPFTHSQCTKAIYKLCGVAAWPPACDFGEMTRFGGLDAFFEEHATYLAS